MMHGEKVDHTTSPEFSAEARLVKRGKTTGEARAVPPGMVLWSEELEARRLAVARWRGLGRCAGEGRAQ